MKAKLKLTINKSLLQRMKAYAAKKQISLSELVEGYFEKIVQPGKRKTVVDMVEEMEVPGISVERNLVDEHYNDIENKYGV